MTEQKATSKPNENTEVLTEEIIDNTNVEQLETPKPEDVAEPEKKRGRGRPKGTTKNNSSNSAPKAEKLSADEKPKPKRRTTQKSADRLAQQLVGFHRMVAQLPGLQLMEIGEQEAEILADAMSDISKEYDVQMSGKTGATLNLVLAASMVYGPRVLALNKMKKQQAFPGAVSDGVEMPRPETADNVTDFSTAGNGKPAMRADGLAYG